MEFAEFWSDTLTWFGILAVVSLAISAPYLMVTGLTPEVVTPTTLVVRGMVFYVLGYFMTILMMSLWQTSFVKNRQLTDIINAANTYMDFTYLKSRSHYMNPDFVPPEYVGEYVVFRGLPDLTSVFFIQAPLPCRRLSTIFLGDSFARLDGTPMSEISPQSLDELCSKGKEHQLLILQ